VENSPKPHNDKHGRNEREAKPPGQFVTNELEEHTARFLREIKGMTKRRKEAKADETSGPPPQPPDQRSRRR
jgi:hypothetical protein